MFPEQRRHLIVERLRAQGSATLRQLADAVGVSEVTIRRDLRLLESEGMLVRSRGGASLVSQEPGDPAGNDHEDAGGAAQDGARGTGDERFEAAAQPRAVRQKRAIAALAATLVAEGDAVLLGAGTTTQQLADQLRGVPGLTVVTNSLLVGEALAGASGAGVVLTGGWLHGSSFALVGSAAEQALEGLRARRAFLSGDGLSIGWGLSVATLSAAGVDRAIADAAAEVFVLADSAKIGHDSLFRTVPSDRIAHLVTDDGADPALVDAFTAAGVTVHVAAVPPQAAGPVVPAQPV